MSRDAWDVLILGSGFGASLLATILAREGLSVAMLDRGRHPRFAIGESSTPAADFLLHELVQRYHLSELEPLVRFGTWRAVYPQLDCGCKRGFSYFYHASPGGYRPTRDHQHELMVAASPSRSVADTQWYRPDLDAFLVELAEQSGVTYAAGTQVTAIDHPSTDAWIVSTQSQARRDSWRAKFIVDATGPAASLLQRLGVADWTSRLRTNSTAVYSHWDHMRPLEDWLVRQGASLADHPYPCEQAAVHHLFADGWLWQLRFESGRTSVGFVQNRSSGSWSAAATPAANWSEVCKKWPAIADLLGPAQLAPLPGGLVQTGRLQRLFASAAGDDWAALPFTAGFIDPLHSTGIAHTLSGVERISRCLLQSSGSLRQTSLRQYAEDVIQELLHIDRLVSGCYVGLVDFQLFTAWSMLYFAAATTFEKRWRAGNEQRARFLCADDVSFVAAVQDLHGRLFQLDAENLLREKRVVAEFCEAVRIAVEPFNHVGLFEPAIPNMYRHTVAQK